MTRQLTWVRMERWRVQQMHQREIPLLGSQAALLVQRAQLLCVLMARWPIPLLLRRYVLAGHVTPLDLTTSCAAMHVRHARRFPAALDGLQTVMPPPRCALELLAIQVQETWRHAATRTRALRYRSQAVLCLTTQAAMAVLLDWS